VVVYQRNSSSTTGFFVSDTPGQLQQLRLQLHPLTVDNGWPWIWSQPTESSARARGFLKADHSEPFKLCAEVHASKLLPKSAPYSQVRSMVWAQHCQRERMCLAAQQWGRQWLSVAPAGSPAGTTPQQVGSECIRPCQPAASQQPRRRRVKIDVITDRTSACMQYHSTAVAAGQHWRTCCVGLGLLKSTWL